MPSTVKMNESVSGLPILLLMPESGNCRRFVAKSHFLFVNAPLRKHPSGINEDQKKSLCLRQKKDFAIFKAPYFQLSVTFPPLCILILFIVRVMLWNFH